MALWPSIIIVAGLGMQFMFIGIMTGLPVFVSMMLLFGGIYLGIAILAGESEYIADETGLTKKIGPLSFAKWVPKRIVRHFKWNEIEWYKAGSDLNRSLEPYQYLKVKVSKWPFHIQISSDKADLTGYEQFAQVFSQYVDNEPIVGPTIPEVIPSFPGTTSSNKRRPEFYETRMAKLVFWGFALFLVGLIFWMNETGVFKWTYLYRFLFVIIPGMAYFYYRIYVKPGKKSQS